MTRLWLPGDSCPHTDCDGYMRLERHLSGCRCDPTVAPCAVCLDAAADVIALDGDPKTPDFSPRPWICCSVCLWEERDGGVSAHARVEAMRRRGRS